MAGQALALPNEPPLIHLKMRVEVPAWLILHKSQEDQVVRTSEDLAD